MAWRWGQECGWVLADAGGVPTLRESFQSVYAGWESHLEGDGHGTVRVQTPRKPLCLGGQLSLQPMSQKAELGVSWVEGDRPQLHALRSCPPDQLPGFPLGWTPGSFPTHQRII